MRQKEDIRRLYQIIGIDLSPEMLRKAEAQLPGWRLVVLDLKLPADWPRPLIKWGILITSPFGATQELAGRGPWEVIDRCFDSSSLTELYGGWAYTAAGEKT